MFVHEYHAKQLLKEFGFEFPSGSVADTPAAAESVAHGIDADFWVVKAQILAGDRARFGGVKIGRSVPEVGSIARELLGTRLVTTQTGSQGLPVLQVYVEQGCSIQREMYLAVVVDRQIGSLVLLASVTGGTGVETQDHDRVRRVDLEVSAAPDRDVLAGVAGELGLSGDAASRFADICFALHGAVIELDATAIELNPLALTADGRLMGLDVKMELDDNASFRRERKVAPNDRGENPDRVMRSEAGYNYARLNGNIGLLVSGAGLALATMDLIMLHGGEPANFLDLPPVATSSNVTDACRRLIDDTAPKSLFVNVVGGGLTDCGTVAEGLIAAYRDKPFECPIIVRFSGASKEHGVVLLRNAGVPFELVADMRDAADRLIAISGRR